MQAIKSKLVAEFVGTALLLMGVVGSGIMAETLTDDVGLQLFQNAVATAGVLIAIILAFQTVSGAHFNPVVTLTEVILGKMNPADAIGYLVAQVSGAMFGVMMANLMFELNAVNISTKDRSSNAEFLAEVIATVGLLVIIFAVVRGGRDNLVAFAVAGYITGAYYFTSSTSFANPAVAVARTLSNTFAGIAPGSAVRFVAAQLVGLGIAVVLISVIYPTRDRVS